MSVFPSSKLFKSFATCSRFCHENNESFLRKTYGLIELLVEPRGNNEESIGKYRGPHIFSHNCLMEAPGTFIQISNLPV
jgi:hypothetical protein